MAERANEIVNVEAPGSTILGDGNRHGTETALCRFFFLLLFFLFLLLSDSSRHGNETDRRLGIEFRTWRQLKKYSLESRGHSLFDADDLSVISGINRITVAFASL